MNKEDLGLEEVGLTNEQYFKLDKLAKKVFKNLNI